MLVLVPVMAVMKTVMMTITMTMMMTMMSILILPYKKGIDDSQARDPTHRHASKQNSVHVSWQYFLKLYLFPINVCERA
jgi:uncharacterized membrane protein